MDNNIKILFQDNDIIVCIKPVGVLSEDGTQDNPGMPLLLSQMSGCTVYPVHRLDKGVGGLMAFAKNKEAAAGLSSRIVSGDFVKCYYALVYGETQDSDVFEDLLYKDRAKNKTFVVKRERKGVKKAKLSFEKICEGELGSEKVSLVKVRLYTGRSHQIRVQFASRKHPLVGDRRYGSKDEFKNIELYSCSLTFRHPKSGEKLHFEAKPFEKLNMHRLVV